VSDPVLPPLKWLRPEQYQSWLKKVDDPDWYAHRYRTNKDRWMANAIRELRDTRDQLLMVLHQLDMEREKQ
jgi:hypothetical protein